MSDDQTSPDSHDTHDTHDTHDRLSIERAIEDVARDAAERDRIQRRLQTARTAAADADQVVTTARGRLRDETADVDVLESMSPTRVWAALRGTRDDDLNRERAEVQRAEYDVARAESRFRDAAAEVELLRARLAELGDVDARRTEALAAKEAFLVRTGAPGGDELAAASDRLGVLRSERTELEEADRAGREAHGHLEAAVALLEKASSWSSWDTFGGGGLLTDSIKYDRMDQASAALGAADRSLRLLADELADVQLEGVSQVGVSSSLRTFDVWFDNIFSDWAVRSRIREALEAAGTTRQAVRNVGGVLRQRLEANAAEAERLSQRRAELLG